MHKLKVEAIHKTALEVVSRYRSCEADLIEVLQQADSYRVCYELGYNSLYHYCTAGLGLSEDVAYNFINLARKAKEVPALKQEIRDGNITVSKARKIVPVLNKNNQTQWLELAKTVSKKELEKAVVIEKPELLIQEKVKFVQAERVQIQFGASPELANKLQRARELESQKRGRVESLENAVSAMADVYLYKEDPLQKAKRFADRRAVASKGDEKIADAGPKMNDAHLKKLVPGQVNVHGAAKMNREIIGENRIAPSRPQPASSTPLPLRRPYISSAIRHQLHLKFNGQCGHIDSAGKRCEMKRFLHVHHIKPVSEGGDNSLKNLELLCSGHHQTRHH